MVLRVGGQYFICSQVLTVMTFIVPRGKINLEYLRWYVYFVVIVYYFGTRKAAISDTTLNECHWV